VADLDSCVKSVKQRSLQLNTATKHTKLSEIKMQDCKNKIFSTSSSKQDEKRRKESAA